MESPREPAQRGHADAEQRRDTCALTHSDSTNGSSAVRKGHKATDETDLRHTVVRLLEKLSVLESRQFETSSADYRKGQAELSTGGESDLSQLVVTNIVGMWQAYLGAG